jgi:hypothetical protein
MRPKRRNSLPNRTGKSQTRTGIFYAGYRETISAASNSKPGFLGLEYNETQAAKLQSVSERIDEV